MQRFKLTLEYDGTGYCGWQRQKESVSLQEVLEDAIFELTGEKVEAIASGRTDAGVHAINQVAHFDLEKGFGTDKILKGLNYYLKGKPISIISVDGVDDDFHARFKAKKRHYRYIILNRKSPPVLQLNRVWYVIPKLDVDAMRGAAKYLIGEHDFSSFRASACQAKNPVKTMESITITEDGDKIYFDITAISFLHHMCRNIVGTLKEVGEGKRISSDIPKMIKAKNRSTAGATAPAHGLYFVSVEY